KKYVFVIDENNIVKSRLITVGAEMPHVFVVTSGLTENDKILLEGLRRVRENQKIDIEFVEPAIALSKLELYAE
ncbi:MAG TPA: efflux RND transporter periplasmic adaptor subunit, partial [Cyclobacteriaceae bacterium]|nr:efflux RND transporter periplasmic adaptor subunit [Cyclobacteriaceae bacterium]